MAEKNDPKPRSNPEQEAVGDTRRLEKATEELAAGAIEGTLMSIEAHTGEHPAPDSEEASVTDSLKKAKGGGALPATMYGPTRPGQAKVGSTAATQFGPTDAGRPPSGAVPAATGGASGSMGTGGGAVAPFGGKIMVGTRVGQIEVTGVLGKGGMGEVFRGYHHALDIQVAIKVLPDELSRNDLVRQRFLREARLCVKLDHPNIVRVYNVDEHAGNLFLVMELIEGTDAANMLKNGGRFKYRRALEIGAASADALGYAHSQGLVHRDVKPHNILLGRDDGKIKLSDFGLARAATSSSHLTMSGQIMGTPHYMSPEQAESKEVTDKADVYSLGVTLYHMLTGETPFVGDTPISVAVQHIAKEILYPEARFAAFPKELVAVLKRMTAKDASKRCSAKQAAVWLRKLISMAPAEDIQVAPDAMATMAPVVRESQAFEAAAKARQEQDERAREAARTMIATMREVAIPPTMQAPQPQAQAQSQPAITPMPQKKSGGIAAAAAVLLLLGGGGAAAWWFTMGPGAQKANNAPLVAGSNGSEAPGDNRGTIGVNANSNGGGTTNQPANNAGNPPVNGNPDNPPANNSPDIPPAQEDKFINTKLEAAGTAIAGASGLADLQPARERLEEVKAELDRASERQKAEHAELEKRFARQYALLSARETFATMRAALADHQRLRDTDRTAAALALNTALGAADALQKLNVPPEVEPLIRTDRETVTADLEQSVSGFETMIGAESTELEGGKQFAKAAEALAPLLSLRLKAERLEPHKLRRLELQTRGRHAEIYGALERAAAGDHKKLKDADALLAETGRAGVPQSLQTAHAAVTKAVRDAVAARLDAVLQDAARSAAEGEFGKAKATLEGTDGLPLDSDQSIMVANELFFLGLKEQLALADKSITDGQLKDAQARLKDAQARIQGATDRTIPQTVTERLKEVQARFDAQLSQKFENLLAAAEADMKERDFEGAARNVAEASDLPLTEDQDKRLDAFNESNQQALAAYLVELLDKVEAALDKGDFETANSALARANAIAPGKESDARLIGLQTRFANEAIKRHSDLLAAGEKALEDRRYDAVREALAALPKVPVETTRREKEDALSKRYLKLLGEDAAARLAAADKLIEDGKFKEARAAVDAALGLAPADSELREKVRLKHEAINSRIATVLADVLQKAAKARETAQFKESAARLAEADALRDVLSPEQLGELSTAQDKQKSELRAWLDTQFKELENSVQRGLEEAGKKVADKIENQPLGEPDKRRVRELRNALTGETEEARYQRLPEHLKKLANGRTLKAEQLIKVGEAVSALYATPDSKFAACGTATGKVIFYNLRRGTQMGQSSSGRRKVTAVAIDATGNLGVAGNDDGALVLFERDGTAFQARPLEGVGDVVTGVAFSPDSKVLYVLSRKGEITRFNPANRSKLGSTSTGLGGAMALAVSPDGRYLAAGGKDAEIVVMNGNTMVLNKKLQGPGDDQIKALNFSHDSRQLIAGSNGDGVGVWDTGTLSEKPVRQLKGLSEWVCGTGFSADGKRCAALDNEKRIVVWDPSRSSDSAATLEFQALVAKGEDITVDCAWVASSGAILIGTREGNLIHLTVRTPN